MEVTATKSVSQDIIEQVAAAECVDPLDLPVPLYEVIDPDALDALLSASNASSVVETRVSFTYCGYAVVVTADGTVSISPAG